VDEKVLVAYAVLGVDPETGFDEIHRRYRILVQICHPDRYQSSPPDVREEATRMMQRIGASYALLREVKGGRETRERETREREAREREARERAAREREERARQARAREARAREAAREREAREREAQQSNSGERDDGFRMPPGYRDIRERSRPLRWSGSGVHPVRVSFPSGDDGYTMRAYLDDGNRATFLRRDDCMLLFREAGSLSYYLLNNQHHVLLQTPEWKRVRRVIARVGAIPDPADCFDFDLIMYSFRFPASQWLPKLFINCRDFALELAYEFDLTEVHALLEAGSEIDRADDLLREAEYRLTRRVGRQLGRIDAAAVEQAWGQLVKRIEPVICWR
jgi:hypothetical protein